MSSTFTEDMEIYEDGIGDIPPATAWLAERYDLTDADIPPPCLMCGEWGCESQCQEPMPVLADMANDEEYPL